MRLISCVLILAALLMPAYGQETAEEWLEDGVTFVMQGNYAEAVQAFDEAIRLDPEHAAAWNNKGLALKLLGRTTEANEAYAKAEKLGFSG